MFVRAFFAVSLILGMTSVAWSQAPSAPPSKPELPKVVLIGDSIRMGYAPRVAKRLEGKAIVISAEENGGDSARVLANLDKWAISEKPAVVHFNAGIHDLKIPPGTGKSVTELPAYADNLKQIVARLRQETAAAIVFANTTPVIDERHNVPAAKNKVHNADVQKYNDAALAVMREADVPVDDLNELVTRGGIEALLTPDGVHYGGAGRDVLADAVADCILRQLIVARFPGSGAPEPKTPEQAAGERRNEAQRDAQVPAAYKKLPIGVFHPPADAGAWKAQRPGVRDAVVRSLGDLPPRPSPQKVRVVSRELRRHYVLERVAIDNGAEGEVTALVLLPGKPKPTPAVLWLHSSTPDKNQIITPSTNGGAEPLGETLAKAGYVVMAPDACWYGDRAEQTPAGTAEVYRRDVLDSFRVPQESLLKLNLWLGRTLWGMMVRDDQIALDYLCSRPEVDPHRIGATGMSMGSTRCWWLAAVDDRIACTVAVACLTRYQNLIAHGELRAHGVYYFVNGLLKNFDTEGVLALIAPRPLLALTGDLDRGSPVDGIRELEKQVGGVYETLGARECFKNVIYPDTGHVYTPQMRAELLAWFDHWLKPAE